MIEYRNVLVIDDDTLTTELIREILISEGYQCQICQSVKSLQKCLKKVDFDIFFIDLMIDGLQGINLIKEIRDRFPEAIIIVITGLSAGEFLQDVIEAGADHYFNKPINAVDLLKRLKTIEARINESEINLSLDKIFRFAFTDSSNPVFITDNEGNLFFANSQFLQLTSLAANRIYRYNLQAMHLEKVNELSKLIERCDTTMVETRVIETRFNHGKENEIWFNAIINPVKDPDDKSRMFFLFQLYDITRKKQMDTFILNNEEKFRSFISLSNDGMALVNEKGQVIEWNGSLSRITGISMEKVYGEMIWDILSWGNIKIREKLISSSLIKRYLISSLKNGLGVENAVQNNCQITHTDGHIVHLQYSLFTISMDNGYRLGMVIRDNTASVNDRKRIADQNEELNRAYLEMEKLSRIDPLTQISNRRDVEIRLNYEFTRFERYQHPFSLAIADIDNFKNFNDTYGHDMGDFVLTKIAELMSDTIRAQDILGRWGGEEFILVFPDTDLGGGEIITERIRANIENHKFIFNNITVSVTITTGMAQFRDGDNLDATLKRADNALYKGKESGKNCVAIAR